MGSQDSDTAMDIGWTLFAGCLVFFMQAGFSLLEAGFVRSKNTQSILLKNILDLCIGAVGWFVLGYGLAFGKDSWDAENGGGFLGTNLFFVNDSKLLPTSSGDVLYDDWFFQFTFCATAATIVSGALAERCRIEGYIIFSLLMSLVFYPIVVHWTWGGGFLAKKGYLDFAGSGIVHMFGGFAALTGAAVLGPRKERFLPGAEEKLTPSSLLHVTLGTFILFFGWFGFNAGSTTALSGGGAATAARCCVTTTMSAACGGLVAFTLASFRRGRYDVSGFCNGILGGLVGITAGCANVDPVIAGLIGIVSGFVVEFAGQLLEKVGVDDPIGAFPVHGACGVWGVIAAGLFDLNRGWWSTNAHFDDAIGPNLVGIVCIGGWAVGTCGPLFLALKKAGLLRASEEQEELGLDIEFALSSIRKPSSTSLVGESPGLSPNYFAQKFSPSPLGRPLGQSLAKQELQEAEQKLNEPSEEIIVKENSVIMEEV